jgi:uncharacterized protein YeaO (DUF488 family)
VLGIRYVHLPQFAPTQELLDAYKKAKGDWSEYETKFLALMAKRKVEQTVERAAIDGGCLLCSEPAPEHCHRRWWRNISSKNGLAWTLNTSRSGTAVRS